MNCIERVIDVLDHYITRMHDFPYAGSWRVLRHVVPFDGKPAWTFEGQAEIGERSFVEDGTLTTDGVTLRSGRRYRLEQDASGTVAVRRWDGSAFITLRGRPVQAVTHLCGDDRYTGRFLFRDSDRWVEIWRVLGPRKVYRSVTRFVRGSPDMDDTAANRA